MSSESSAEKRKTEDNFQDYRDVLLDMDKADLVEILQNCWESENVENQKFVLNGVTKKRKKDDEKRKRIEQIKKDIYETNWIFPGSKDYLQNLNIKEGVIKIGLYKKLPKDGDVSDLQWDDDDGVLTVKIEGNGCDQCHQPTGSDEVLTILLERSDDETKKRIKVSSYAECACSYVRVICEWPVYHDDAGFMYGYPKGAVEENKFGIKANDTRYTR